MGTVTTVGPHPRSQPLHRSTRSCRTATTSSRGPQRAYDPNYNWLNLNLATAPGVTGAYIAGLLRDRLAGICRRIVANHSSGLSAAVLATLNQCGNPSSGFFDPLLNDIPTILNTLSGESGADHGAVAPAAGPAADRQRRAGRQADTDGAVRRVDAGQKSPALHVDHDDHDGAEPTTTTTTTVRPPRRDPRLLGRLGLGFGFGLELVERRDLELGARRPAVQPGHPGGRSQLHGDAGRRPRRRRPRRNADRP